MRRILRLLQHSVLGLFLAALGLAAVPALAQDGQAALNIYNESPYQQLPLKQIQSRTVIDGPLARTRLSYLVENKNKVRTEVGLNFHLPQDTVLHAFGYYYKGRFIRGKMYDNDEAWHIYQAVTSRGRDPGIMDRPTAQDYHVQVYPVEAGQDLRLVVELTQVLSVDAKGSHFELPLTQANGATRDIAVQADVQVQGHSPAEISTNDPDHVQTLSTPGGATARLAGQLRPQQNWRLTIARRTHDLAAGVFSALSGPGNGYYALMISPARALRQPRVTLRSRPGTDLSLPTRFNAVPAQGRLYIVGRYRRPETLSIVVQDQGGRPVPFQVRLTGRTLPESENPAAKIWADKRIDVLQSSPRRGRREQVVRLSKRYTVVSRFTALLAIPREELDYYKKVLARQKVSTNTQYTGGGGGDPYIAVKAPADAQQVVAVFPTGDVKNLVFNGGKGLWDGRFDIPFGTPEGEYRVSVIVVHKDGHRSQFVLVYQNRLTGPVATDLTTLHARPGSTVALRVEGANIYRAFAVTPWGERVDLSAQDDAWTAPLTVPATWTQPSSLVTIVLLDGAHNRTEVSVDLAME